MLDEHGVDIGSEQMADLIGDAGITVCKWLELLDTFERMRLICLN